MASNGAEPIGSLGYDGPLAALSPERQNLADYFKETVAVVTNPAIDREREMEHFSTRAVFGRRPVAARPGRRHAHGRDLVPGPPRRPSRPRAARRLHLPARSRASTRPGCSRTCGRSSATAPRRSTRRCSSPRRTAGRDRAAQAGGGAARPRRRRADRAHRPHGLRRRAPLPRPAPRDLGDRSGAEAVPRRAAAPRTCAAAARSCCARRRSATSTTSSSRSGSAPTASTRT